jgi:hypothetical protein
VETPAIRVGTPEEYAHWEAELRTFLTGMGRDPSNLERVDARYHYNTNQITLYHLANPSDEFSVADTISHEVLHALLYQMGERLAARAIDWAGAPVGNPRRAGGI